MTLPILQTKLFMPRLRTNLVPRHALQARLVVDELPALTLVSAPAGFGKTTLVSSWCNALMRQQTTTAPACCWLALDEEDNDLARFLSYFVAALQTVDGTLGATLQSILLLPQLPPPSTLLTYLLNDLGAAPRPILLVLDDYHLITAQPIHEALTYLVENLPPRLHLIITTRIDPPLPLARWRVRNRLTEVRASDLRFSAEEAALFLNDLMGLSLSALQISTLEERTEGWIAALQLAALSMQGRQDLADFVAAFGGSNRFIVDYLAEEVWHRLPNATQRFLMQTALLDRVCAELGEAVTGQANVQALLWELDLANLFLIPLDDERHWYRYHHLFRDLLLQRLHTHYDSDTIHALHQRAAQWYADTALTDEAIHHYLAAAAIEQAADLIEAIGYQVIGQGYLGRLGLWLDQLPLTLVRARPRLVLWRAWVLNLTGQPALLEAWLQEAELTLDTLPPSLAQDLRAQIITLHAYHTRRQGQLPLAIAQLHQALADCAADNLLTRTAINLNLGFNYWMTGQFPLAATALIATQREASLICATHMVLLARATQANVAVAQGRLQAATQLCEATIQAALTVNGGQPFPSAGYAYAVLGNILYEQNELTAAEVALRQALELGELMADGTVVRRAIFGLAPLRQMRGEQAAAQGLWQRAFAINDTVEEPQVALQQVHAWLVQAATTADQGALAQANQWATTYRQSPVATNGYVDAFAQTLLAWLALLQGEPAQALAHLEPLISVAAATDHIQQLIAMLVVQAMAHAAVGDALRAQGQLHQLLRLTAAEGYVRVFVDAGEAMRLLLIDWRQRATGEDQLVAYLNQVLAAYPAPSAGQTLAPHTIQPASGPISVSAEHQPTPIELVESLSDRELEILQLVADGLSNNAIADTLIVTVGTVKKHLNNIYGKLGVGSRTQAVARARELHLF